MSNDFYQSSILPFVGIIIKICRAYTNNQEDFEDYYQEVCLQIWRTRERFQGNSEWSTWVYRVSLNVCLTLLKKKKNSHQYYASDALPDEVEIQDNVFDDEALNMLYAAIRHLSEVDRAIILLHLEGKKHEDIGLIMGTNANNIGVRINRIKQRLKKLLDGKIY